MGNPAGENGVHRAVGLCEHTCLKVDRERVDGEREANVEKINANADIRERVVRYDPYTVQGIAELGERELLSDVGRRGLFGLEEGNNLRVEAEFQHELTAAEPGELSFEGVSRVYEGSLSGQTVVERADAMA